MVTPRFLNKIRPLQMRDTLLQPIESVPRDELERLFDEESAMWGLELNWSFAPTRARLEEAFDAGKLLGFAARDDKGVCAYATYAINDDQGMVGALFASSRVRGRGLEGRLAGRVLDSLMAGNPRVIDCQTLFSSAPDLLTPFAERGFTSATRTYMVADREAWAVSRQTPPRGAPSQAIRRSDVRAVAGLVYGAHLQSRALDASSSFDTRDSCARILDQVMLDQVCGPFDWLGSRRIEMEGALVAASLLTWPLDDAAHISEVATAPSHRLMGLARQCLAESMESAFGRRNTRVVTLSVTASNQPAVDLYKSLGFRPRIRYQSHIRRRPA